MADSVLNFKLKTLSLSSRFCHLIVARKITLCILNMLLQIEVFAAVCLLKECTFVFQSLICPF